MKTLEGKVAVITGGSSGIGLATAKLFQEVGARVTISGRNQQSLDAAVKELGAGIIAVRSDVSKLSDLDTLFEVVTKKLGRIDVLFAKCRDRKLRPRRRCLGRRLRLDIRHQHQGGVLHCPESHPLPERQSFGHSEHIVRQPSRVFPQPAFTQRVRGGGGIRREHRVSGSSEAIRQARGSCANLGRVNSALGSA